MCVCVYGNIYIYILLCSHKLNIMKLIFLKKFLKLNNSLQNLQIKSKDSKTKKMCTIEM